MLWVEGADKVSYEGMPPDLLGVMVSFTEQDKWDNFKAVLECAVAIHATVAVSGTIDVRQSIIRASTRASVFEEQKELISAATFQKRVEENFIWKQEDPSSYYDVYS